MAKLTWEQLSGVSPVALAKAVTELRRDAIAKAALAEFLIEGAAVNVDVARHLAKSARSEPSYIVKAASESTPYVLGVAVAAADPICKGLSEDDVEEAAWSFLRNNRAGAVIGVDHGDGTSGTARIVESYINRQPQQWHVTDIHGNSQVVKRGDWLIGGLLSPDAWARYRASGRPVRWRAAS